MLLVGRRWRVPAAVPALAPRLGKIGVDAEGVSRAPGAQSKSRPKGRTSGSGARMCSSSGIVDSRFSSIVDADAEPRQGVADRSVDDSDGG
jgi:hypothetical protein